MGDFRVSVVFGGVRNFTVPVLLGTLYIDCIARGIFTPKEKIVLYNSRPIPILALNHMPVEFKDENKDRPKMYWLQKNPHTCCVAQGKQTFPQDRKRPF